MTSGNDDGYTFTEVLAALAILSFSGLLLWSGLNLGIRSIGKINGRNKETGDIILLEYYFRREIGNRGAAYWEKEFSETYGGLYEKDDLLMLEEEGRVYAFPPPAPPGNGINRQGGQCLYYD